MNVTVQVAMIAGAAGVLGGLAPAMITGRFAKSQAAETARREHAAWLRERRYTACAELLDAAKALGHQAFTMKHVAAERQTTASEMSEMFLDHMTPLVAAVHRLGVLGPPELSDAAHQMLAAALRVQAAFLGNDGDAQDAATELLAAHEVIFREAARRALSPPGSENA